VAFGSDGADLEAHYRPLRGIAGTLLTPAAFGVSGNDANSIGEKGCSRGATEGLSDGLRTTTETTRCLTFQGLCRRSATKFLRGNRENVGQC
jgi:hypothetical protein